MIPLSPSDLVRPGARLGHTVVVKERTGSSNDDALGLAAEGAAEGVCVLAEEQLSGRGRRGRRWWSEPGANLLFSVILRPPTLERPGLYTLATGVGLAVVLRAEGLEARIKWPNDLLVRGRKIAGVLGEAGADAVVLGVGLNVNQTVFDPELGATSVALELGRELSRAGLFRRALAGLEQAVGRAERAPGRLFEEWMELAECRGRRVRAETPGGTFAGEAVGVSPDGALLVRDDGGRIRAVIAGDVRLAD